MGGAKRRSDRRPCGRVRRAAGSWGHKRPLWSPAL